MTKRLIHCEQIMGIAVLDHIIIGDDCFISLVDGGYLNKDTAKPI